MVMKRVIFENGTSMYLSDDELKELFGSTETTTTPELETNMAVQKDPKLEAASFSNLVRAIDEKWSHTYEDFPAYTEDMKEELDKLAEVNGDFDFL